MAVILCSPAQTLLWPFPFLGSSQSTSGWHPDSLLLWSLSASHRLPLPLTLCLSSGIQKSVLALRHHALSCPPTLVLAVPSSSAPSLPFLSLSSNYLNFRVWLRYVVPREAFLHLPSSCHPTPKLHKVLPLSCLYPILVINTSYCNGLLTFLTFLLDSG